MSKKCPSPTEQESEHLMQVKMLPCYIGYNFPDEAKHCSKGCYRDAHHELEYGRRISHYETSSLCENHHSPQSPLPFGESYHNGKARFEAKYGDRHVRVKWKWEMLENG
jgi:hypothetical protein